MSIIALYRNGFRKSVRSFRPIVLLWIVSLAGSLLVVAPLESNIGKLLDGTLVSELLYDGFNIDVFADIMNAVLPALASFSVTFFLVAAIMFLANTFITAGLYRTLAGNWKKPFKRRVFLRGADRGFGSFLFIALAAGLVIFILALILVVIPLAILAAIGVSWPAMLYTGYAAGFIVILCIPAVLLVADYARAMITADKYLSPFRAITGASRSVARRRFMKAWTAVMIIIVLSVVVGYVSTRLIVYSNVTGRLGIFLLLIVSQLFVFLKTWLKVFRYGTVVALFETSKE